jgi:hypothetical protein
MIRNLPQQQYEGGTQEIIELARSIHAVDNSHSLINLIIETLNIQHNVGLNEIVRVAAHSPFWATYVSELRDWLSARRLRFLEIGGS